MLQMNHNGNNMEINERLDKIEQTLERLEAALVGDKFNGSGYKGRLETIEDKVRKLENRQTANSWLETGAKLVVGAAIAGVINYLINH
jgi:BMFP domain-containing protein YqiC